MPLAPGDRLGPYEIEAPLGAGGMGEVYRGRDSRLGRAVAVKVLPREYAEDAERLRRFEQEARATGALSHPNILAVYDVGTEEGTPYLVSELLEGQTLRELLADGPLPWRKACKLAAEAARGLAAAHDKGIVHRDLKPENLMLTAAGHVKILDFGLAKLTQPEEAEAQRTLTAGHGASTEAGTVLGTVGYMSPEQVRGRPADHRADIFALGAVLWELLTGRPAFAGATAADIMSAILREDPPEPEGSGRQVPLPVLRIVRHALEKRPEDRFQSALDLAFQLEALPELGSGSALGGPVVEGPAGRSWRRALPWAAAALLAAVAMAALWVPTRGDDEDGISGVARFQLPLPEGVRLVTGPGDQLALSPDGRTLVFSALEGASDSVAEPEFHLYIRSLDRLETRRLPATRNALHPFFYPDGESVGYYARGEIHRIRVGGGPPVTVGSAPDPLGIVALPDGSLLLARTWGSGLDRIPAAGGAAVPVTSVDFEAGEGGHMWPDPLPGGEAAIFTVWMKAPWDRARVAAVSLATGETRTLVEGATFGRYSPSGHLLFVRGSTLLAAPFDPRRLELLGEAVPIADGLEVGLGNGSAPFAIGGRSVLVYGPDIPASEDRRFVWVDRKGEATVALADAGVYSRPNLSRDGRRLATIVEGATYHIWLFDLLTGGRSRFTPEADSGDPIWSPDGSEIYFWSNLGGPYGLYRKPADAAHPAVALFDSDVLGLPIPRSITPEGTALLFTMTTTDGQGDGIWLLDLEGGADPRLLLQTSGGAYEPQISPDGRWLAYISRETGREEIFVTPFPGPGARWQVSTGGGNEPRWNPRGGELFYREPPRRLMSVRVRTDPTFEAARPEVLFENDFWRDPWSRAAYDVAPDGERFLFLERLPVEGGRELVTVLNWHLDLPPARAPR